MVSFVRFIRNFRSFLFFIRNVLMFPSFFVDGLGNGKFCAFFVLFIRNVNQCFLLFLCRFRLLEMVSFMHFSMKLPFFYFFIGNVLTFPSFFVDGSGRVWVGLGKW